MKIPKLKPKSRDKLRLLEACEVDENVEKTLVIDNIVPLDEDLWEDWQRVTAVDHESKVSNRKKRKRKSSLKCEFPFSPVMIELSPTFAPVASIPGSLRTNTIPSQTRRKNKILRDFVSNEFSENPLATITICRTIVPDEIRRKKRKTRNRKSTQSSKTERVDSGARSKTDVSMNLNDTSHVDESNLSLENPINLTLDTSQLLDESKIPHFYSLRDRVICVIEPENQFSFQGKLMIQVLYGAVKVYGALLNKENTNPPVEVYSSRGTNLVSIESTSPKKPENIADVWAALSNDNIDQNISNDLQTHVNNLKTGWAVLRLQNLENNLTNFLKNFSTNRLFPKLDNVSNYSWSDPKRAEVVLQANIHSGNTAKQKITFHRTDGILEDICKRRLEANNPCPRIILAGGKNVGKSTTGRYFVNKLQESAKSVIFIDLDIGQAEFTPPGCISLNVVRRPLLGPNFTHLVAPYHQLYIGGVDPARYLTNYLDGVRQLTEFLDKCQELKGMPVVVNTMGFCKAMGWDIMCCVIKRLRPTNIVQIISKRGKNNYDQLLTSEIMNNQTPTWKSTSTDISTEHSQLDYELHVMDTEAESRNSTEELWNIEPHQQREIVMLAYLSDILKSKRKLTQNLACINEVVPYEIPFSSVSISLGKPVIPQILSVMNGNIVAMCGSDSEDSTPESRKVGYPKVMMRAPPLVCYGFGILRGVDMRNEKLYINTPLSKSKLKYVNCLIGSLPVPSGLLQLNSPDLPYVGDEPELPTSRDSRRGYFRMRHRNDI